MKVIVIDEEHISRSGLVSILQSAPGLSVVGDSATSRALPDMAETLRPDVVVLNVSRMSPQAVAAFLAPGIAELAERLGLVLLHAAGAAATTLHRCCPAARGLLASCAPATVLVHAVSLVGGGGVAVYPAAPVGRHGAVRPAPPPAAVTGLTPQERTALVHLPRGLGNAEIAEAMHVSEASVKKYLSQAMRKIGARNRVEAGVFADRHLTASPGSSKGGQGGLVDVRRLHGDHEDGDDEGREAERHGHETHPVHALN
ncbi:response regulator transcription factor [Streptomyces cinnamoneus]